MEAIQPVQDHNLPVVSSVGDIKYPETKHAPVTRTDTGSQEPGTDERRTDYAAINDTLYSIKTAILKYVEAKAIYLFGSYAYGSPTSKSDIDIYVVVPDSADDIASLYVSILTDLNEKNIYFIDLLFGKESVFSRRKREYILEKTIYTKGKLLHES
jgi:predicted nucleotidyltransferase